MKLIDHIRVFLGLPKNYNEKDLASLCVLFGVSKEQLLDEYTPLTADKRNIARLENFKNMIKEKR